MKNYNFKKFFSDITTLEDLIFKCRKYFFLNPLKGRKLFQKRFLDFYKSQIIKKEIIINLNNKTKLYFPYIKMGKLDSTGMFAYHEHNVFLFYFMRRFNYKKVADIGANIGAHTIILSKLGYSVDAFEPDPYHFKILKKYVKKNKCHNVKLFNKAIFDKNTKLNFTRVLANPAANHITSQKVAYGPISKIKVETVNIKNIIKNYDLVKIDAEGSEGRIIENIKPSQFSNTDFIIEISGVENAKKIFDFCKRNKIIIFSHKILWKKVLQFRDMPTHHSEGLIFISKKNNILNFTK